MKNFPHLFSPIQVGKKEIRNRLAIPAMHLDYCQDGFISDQMVEFYRARAAGGVGLIAVGGCFFDPFGGNPLMIGLNDDKYIPGLKKLTSATQREGAAIVAQLYHSGRYNFAMATGGLQPIAPSPIPAPIFGMETPREMTKDDIEEVKKAFAQGSVRAREAGFDGVEISASTGYLLCQFLSPVTNQRSDEYGGGFENRTRFPREVVETVRKAVGPDFIIQMRVAGCDFVPGCLHNPDVAKVCQIYEKAGADSLNITGGWHESRVPQITMNVPRGAYVYLARGIKEAVKIPVIATNRIVEPEMAEDILKKGAADMVNMGRAMIADPELPNKARAGQTRKIRPCIGCNQGCFDSVFNATPVICLSNPRGGRETDFPQTPPKAARAKKCLVVGAGPAGMEAACNLGERGHQVYLWESGSSLGGSLVLCAAPPGRQEFSRFLPYYEERLKDAGVKVEFNREASLSAINSLAPQTVVIATGGNPIVPRFPGIDKKHVYLAHQVLKQEVWPNGQVVIIGGGATGCETAHWLADADTISGELLKFLFVNRAESNETLFELSTRARRPITIIEMLPKMGQDIGRSTRWTILDELRRSGVKLATETKVLEITDTEVVAENNGQAVRFPADSVIIAVGLRPNDALYKELEAAGKFELYRAGDVNRPRKVMNAIAEGYEVGIKI
ncbi:MAG: FAD-dependent oxidoreductase [bacterium]|nr:FAD-dependent oxidoreductase [bacterium]